MYHHCEEFLETMVSLKQADYSKYHKKICFYLKLDLLVLDDFLLHTIADEREIKVLFKVMEKRSKCQGARFYSLRESRTAGHRGSSMTRYQPMRY